MATPAPRPRPLTVGRAAGVATCQVITVSAHQLALPKLRRKVRKRYTRPVPGDRAQVDVCKITGGIYQYTAIDDCSRFQVAGVFPRKTAANTIAFLTQVRAAKPFPIQRIQTDRGQELFAYQVQDQLKVWRIKFRPTRPRSPHLNGKVERVQRTALNEFWSGVDLNDPAITNRFADWQRVYNTTRPHSSLGGRTPAQRLSELQHKIPSAEIVQAIYDPKQEWARPHHYRWDIGPPKPP